MTDTSDTARFDAKGAPTPENVGVDADLHAHATTRWRDSGYDLRRGPYAGQDAGTQRNYDLYDAWANLDYPSPSPYWPPRTRRGKLLVGRDASNPRQPAVSLEGLDGYEPAAERIMVWGLNGTLAAELAERGTLGTRRPAKRARPDPRPGR